MKRHNDSPLRWSLPKKCLKSALTAGWDVSNLQMLLAINSTMGSEVENASLNAALYFISWLDRLNLDTAC